jgi:hypothetical protein
LEKLARGIFLTCPNFNGEFELNVFPQHDFPTHKHVLHNLVFGHVGEYLQAAHVLTPFLFAPMSLDTTSTFSILHHELNGSFALFLKDYKPNEDFELSFDSFKLTFKCMLHFFASGIYRMVF